MNASADIGVATERVLGSDVVPLEACVPAVTSWWSASCWRRLSDWRCDNLSCSLAMSVTRSTSIGRTEALVPCPVFLILGWGAGIMDTATHSSITAELRFRGNMVDGEALAPAVNRRSATWGDDCARRDNNFAGGWFGAEALVPSPVRLVVCRAAGIMNATTNSSVAAEL